MKKKADVGLDFIVEALKQSERLVFKRSELKAFLDRLDTAPGEQTKPPAGKIIESLVSSGEVEKLQLNFPFRRETRYITRPIQPLEKLILTYPEAYFSHQTAAVVHGLLDSELTELFLNNEQRATQREINELTQERIDFAFRGKPRITTNTTMFSNCLVYLLNGKNTNNLGVDSIQSDTGGTIRVTNIERTLIDMTVRPFYSGGPVEVMNAFRNAMPRVTVSELKKMLIGLDYVYPYHQAIGFYLESAGYSEEEVDHFREMEVRFDFYLAHAMSGIEYSPEWRLYYPQELARLLGS